MKLRIGILGTRGIPNRYGGFEQFAACLSRGLSEKGHEVSVYNTHDHPYKKNGWNGVQVIHCYNPGWLGPAGQFIYDLNCIRNARKQGFDILLVLGYTSSSVWGRWYPRKTTVITNMDGLEWKRSKYSRPVQRFLRYAEKLAVRFSKHHIADSLPIQTYLRDKYAIEPAYISYGAEIPAEENESLLATYGVEKNDYFLLIARMEPENNIEMILDGLSEKPVKKVLVVGGLTNAFGKRMRKKFKEQDHIIFLGTIYDKTALDTLRIHCFLYFHGHSVGGTNPSLLEAMACGALVCAHDNVFNRAVLAGHALYFNTATDIAQCSKENFIDGDRRKELIRHNLDTIRTNNSYAGIIGEYEQLFIQSHKADK